MKSTFSIAAVISCLCILAAGALSYEQRVPSALQIVNFEGKGITLSHEDLRQRDINRTMKMERYDDVLFVPGNNKSLAKLAALDYSPEDYDGLIVQAGKDLKDSEYIFPCKGAGVLTLAWREAGTLNERSCREGVAVNPSKDLLALWQKPDFIGIFQAEKQFLKAEASPYQIVIVPDRVLTLVKTANSDTGIFVYVVLGNVNIKSAQHPAGRQVRAGERYAYPEDKITPIDHYQLLNSPEIQDFLNPNNWLSSDLAPRVSAGIYDQLKQQRAAVDILIASIRQSQTVSLTSLTLNPISVEGGLTAQGWIELSDSAPEGGAIVSLVSSDLQVASVPGRVTVPAGQTMASFGINTREVTSPRQAIVTASYEGVNREALLEVNPPPVTPPVTPSVTPPDPAAQRIDFNLVSQESEFEGRVQIVGVVENIGQGAFESRQGQQKVQLYEINPGGRPQLVAEKPFQNLSPGQEVEVVYERNWDTSSPSEGEFPPTYRLDITYAPDSAMDGNPQNDDTNNSNNTKERSGSDIHNLFTIQEEGPI